MDYTFTPPYIFMLQCLIKQNNIVKRKRNKFLCFADRASQYSLNN